ncbi:transporter substrate-binding domain-containing protein [Seonamhaeicola sp.]|uniref:transporter substrate-binding domain-containing protein n=1 Tax=Seonamhaeicola sp. TaxID=1912245 RepID=UPI00263743B0|nr:transporter substrate-binding domain-containing protein [Seonamhaeicola sp.]
MKTGAVSNTYSKLFYIVLILFFACEKELEQSEEVVLFEETRDLNQIKASGTLKALTVYSGTTYYLYKGRPMGYEFELLERFARYLEVDLKMIVVNNLDELFEKLNSGEGDIIAHGLTVTSNRKEAVSFTDHLYLTKQVLVQKKPDNWRSLSWGKLKKSLVHDPIDLLGDTISVRNMTSYKERVNNLSEELGGTIHIDVLPGELSTDEIIEKVVNGDIKYTIADNNIANIMSTYYPVLDVKVPVSFSQRIAWATRHDSEDLLNAVNDWLNQIKRKADFNVIYNKYFKNKKYFRRRVKSNFYSLNKQQISPYDDLIKTYSKSINWDWRLVASQVYQESKFDPRVSSWAKASGLMQLMPNTAKELGVTNRSDPEQSIRGGTKYLKQIWKNFESVTDSIQRIKFTMASYNCGQYHVFDAQKLAAIEGLDKNVWDDNVENIILKLSQPEYYNHPGVKYGYVRGLEPYNYVKQIFERYQHYIQFVSE